MNKFLKDKKENDQVLYCYNIKQNLSICMNQNKGDLENCKQLNIDYESCLKFINKKLKKSIDELKENES
jgi:hypothetical protein